MSKLWPTEAEQAIQASSHSGLLLSEAAQITGNERLMNVGDEMHHIGDQWQEVAQIFQQASASDNPAGPIQRATPQMLAIAYGEQMVRERLQSMLPKL